jgi:hypothetical protein
LPKLLEIMVTKTQPQTLKQLRRAFAILQLRKRKQKRISDHTSEQ